MKNKLIDLNNHLFAELERLSDEGLTPEQIATEAVRAKSIIDVSSQIVDVADLHLKAVKIVADHGDRFKAQLPMIEDRPALKAVES
ncbi:hypothetical protein [Sphingorhabdus sp. SMR4y]|uniref:hypothetical protein n=1 Tax=Sphingorhabdus sp. SMR4y TaxID=2584094 RepID=UPI000B5D0056|nr:hypothetical protein [Sphingorhabdus sp. SMR4y]ASK88488.1 hypothetical protein SPHFLASMR4Y_01741 [Sphingorhabdus sp. SMR4y]